MTEERYPCDRCGEEFDSIELIPLEIPLTGENWDLCDPCMDDLVEWIEE